MAADDVYRIQRPNVTESVVEGFGVRGAPTFGLSGLVIPVAIVGSSPEDGHLGTVILVNESDGAALGTETNPMFIQASGGTVEEQETAHVWTLDTTNGELNERLDAFLPDPGEGNVLRVRYEGCTGYGTAGGGVGGLNASYAIGHPLSTIPLDVFTARQPTGTNAEVFIMEVANTYRFVRQARSAQFTVSRQERNTGTLGVYKRGGGTTDVNLRVLFSYSIIEGPP